MNIFSIPASRARTNFFDLLDQIDQRGQILITRYGKIKAVLVSPEELDGLEETAQILAIPGAEESIKQGMKEAKKGLGIPLSELK